MRRKVQSNNPKQSAKPTQEINMKTNSTENKTPRKRHVKRVPKNRSATKKSPQTQVREYVEIIFEGLPKDTYVELRAGGRSKEWVSGHYDDPEKLAQDISEIDRDLKPEGIYLSLHQANPEFEAQSPNTYRRSSGSNNSKSDMKRYRFIFIDIDTIRPNDAPATAEGLQHANELEKKVIEELDSLGFPPYSALVQTGNGYQILYRCDLEKAEGEPIVKDFLKAFSDKVSNQYAKVDTVVHDIARIARVPGTMNRKGKACSDRPHRRAKLIKSNKNVSPLTLNTLQQALRDITKTSKSPRSPIQKTRRKLNPSAICLPTGKRESMVEACLTDVLQLPRAISGQNGSCHTFRAACICYEYGLNNEEATTVMQAYNDQMCDPKWSAEEIKHKLADGYKRVQEQGHIGIKALDSESDPHARKPIVLSEGNISDTAKAILKKLENVGIYWRNEKIVQWVEPEFREIDKGRLIALVNQYISLKSKAKDELKQIDCHDPLGRECISIADQVLPEIEEVLKAPMLRSDGSVLDQFGYNKESRTFLVWRRPDNYQTIPERPTEAQANEAIETLSSIVKEFEFASDADRVGWIALILSHVLRRLHPGPWVLFAIIADRPGSGKTLLVKLSTEIGGIGKKGAISDHAADSAELSKRIETAANCGEHFLYLDNIAAGTFVSNSHLASMCTDEKIAFRKLGYNIMKSFPNIMYACLTGNNLRFYKELSRRLITIELKNQEKTNFKYPDIEDFVREHRAEFYRHALILGAWCLQNPTDVQSEEFQKTSIPSFPMFSKLIVGPLLRLTGQNLRDNVTKNCHRESVDTLEIVIKFCDACFGKNTWFRSREIHDILNNPESKSIPPALIESFQDLVPETCTLAEVGKLLANHVDKVHGNLKLEKKNRRNSNQYRIVEA